MPLIKTKFMLFFFYIHMKLHQVKISNKVMNAILDFAEHRPVLTIQLLEGGLLKEK